MLERERGDSASCGEERWRRHIWVRAIAVRCYMAYRHLWQAPVFFLVNAFGMSLGFVIVATMVSVHGSAMAAARAAVATFGFDVVFVQVERELANSDLVELVDIAQLAGRLLGELGVGGEMHLASTGVLAVRFGPRQREREVVVPLVWMASRDGRLMPVSGGGGMGRPSATGIYCASAEAGRPNGIELWASEGLMVDAESARVFQFLSDDVLLATKCGARSVLGENAKQVLGVKVNSTDIEFIKRFVDQLEARLQRTATDRRANVSWNGTHLVDMVGVGRSLIVAGFATAVLVLGIFAVSTSAMMLASVRARTRELGARMACGARPVDLGVQCAVEAICIAWCGAVFGVCLLGVVRRVLESQVQFAVELDLLGVLLAFCAITLVSVASSILPARRAAALRPSVALRDI